MVSGGGKWSRDWGNGLRRGEMVSGGTMAQDLVKGDRLKETGWAVPALWSCLVSCA
jgi:hypothetical protein